MGGGLREPIALCPEGREGPAPARPTVRPAAGPRPRVQPPQAGAPETPTEGRAARGLPVNPQGRRRWRSRSRRSRGRQMLREDPALPRVGPKQRVVFKGPKPPSQRTVPRAGRPRPCRPSCGRARGRERGGGVASGTSHARKSLLCAGATETRRPAFLGPPGRAPGGARQQAAAPLRPRRPGVRPARRSCAARPLRRRAGGARSLPAAPRTLRVQRGGAASQPAAWPNG